MMVTIRSIIDHASSKYQYRMYILHTDITAENQEIIKRMETPNCKFAFVDVSAELEKISKKITLRDYYSATTYYRLFIADMFPQLEKAVYIDSDTIVQGDVSELYDMIADFDLKSK